MRHKMAWAALVCCAVSPIARGQQSQDVQQLQQQVQQLEQETQELKARLAAIEKSQTASPAPTKAVVRPAVLLNSPQPTISTSSPTSAPETPVSEATIYTAPPSNAKQEPTENSQDLEKKPGMDIYGFAMLDMGYDFGQNDPDWFDVMRPTKLPAFKGEFGQNRRFYSGVRQSRFGVKSNFPTKLGELKTIFEFELYGVGVDAGQTTFRLRHAWGELKHIGAGQTWSPFMDPDVFPNSLEYWGPNGMVFFRNVQLRWMPINEGNHQLYFALERPGASGDPGRVSGLIELQQIRARFPAPDMSARLRWGNDRSYFQVAGIGRYIAWDNLTPSQINIASNTWGWGTNVSSNIGVGKKDALKLSITYGQGVENYMNDAPVDVAPIANVGNVVKPIDGEALPVFGMVAFYDRYWSERWSSSIGYSMLNIENARLQEAAAFHRGQYGLANLLFYPTKNAMMGGEFQWGRRDNFADGFTFDDYRIQFGFRYNFDYKLGGPK
jgi:hypothetical protein